MRRPISLTVLLAIALFGVGRGERGTLAAARSFAGPEIILVSGGGLRAPLALADGAENMRLFASLGAPTPLPPGPPAPGTRRPAFALAFFWGSEWRATARDPRRLGALRPEQASSRGWYYPAAGAAPALVT